MPGLADGVHHLAHDLPVVNVFGLPARDAAGVFGAELLDLGRGDLLELRGQALAGLELEGVDEDRARPRDRLAVVDVGEQRELAGHPDGLVVAEGLLPAGDVVVDHLGDGGVVADDDEDGGRLAVLLRVGVLPRGERFRVGVVERVERAFEQARHLVRGDRALLAALLRQPVLDARPEVEEAHVGRGRVVVDGDAGDLHDAGLDRLDQAEVGDHPGEQRALPVAGAGQEGRGGGQVVDRLDAEPSR